MSELNLMPGAWRVEVVKTVRASVWVVADTPDEAKRAAGAKEIAAGALTAETINSRHPTIQEAGQWFGVFGKAGAGRVGVVKRGRD